MNKVIVKYSMVMRANKMRLKIDNWTDLPEEFRVKAMQGLAAKEQLYEMLGMKSSFSVEMN